MSMRDNIENIYGSFSRKALDTVVSSGELITSKAIVAKNVI